MLFEFILEVENGIIIGDVVEDCQKFILVNLILCYFFSSRVVLVVLLYLCMVCLLSVLKLLLIVVYGNCGIYEYKYELYIIVLCVGFVVYVQFLFLDIEVLLSVVLLYDLGVLYVNFDLLYIFWQLMVKEWVLVVVYFKVSYMVVLEIGKLCEEVGQVIGQYYEWFDGSGYFFMLIKEKIFLIGLILVFVDVMVVIIECGGEGVVYQVMLVIWFILEEFDLVFKVYICILLWDLVVLFGYGD